MPNITTNHAITYTNVEQTSHYFPYNNPSFSLFVRYFSLNEEIFQSINSSFNIE